MDSLFWKDMAPKAVEVLVHATFIAAVFTLSSSITIKEFFRELKKRQPR